MTMMNQTKQTKRDSKESKPPALVKLDVRHAMMLSDILKRTARASSIENDWILHTIDVIDAQLAR